MYDAVSARLAARAGVGRRAPVRCRRLGVAARAAGPRLRARRRHRPGRAERRTRRSTGCRCSPTPTPATATRSRPGATARAYAAAGIAGLHLEDQVAPKRCGHLAGKQVVDVAEAAARVRAAVEAESGIVVVARTDALGVEGVASATERCVAFAEAGADAVFVEGAGIDDLAEVVEDVPETARRSSSTGPRRPATSRRSDWDALRELGVRVVIHPVSALLAAAQAQAAVYAAIAAHGDAGAVARLGWGELTDLVGLPDLLTLEQRYAAGDPS